MDEQVIFLEALEHEDADDQSAFLDRACGKDTQLRQRLQELLAAKDRVGDFMEEPAAPGLVASGGLDPLETCGTKIGPYTLSEFIAEGGMGVVYKAQQQEPIQRQVALKIIKLGMDTKQVVARFEAERQALALMDHPNIAKVFDAGTTETGRPYFVMELVRGIPITHYCDQEKLSPASRIDLVTNVCHAIQHAHQKGIIHRDIKPSNILITRHDGVPVPKVIDFGIAKATQQELTEKTIYTQFEQFIGTPAYMSPEQAEMSGLDIDTRSDIYSLGVLLYELLTGTTPFDANELLRSGLDEMRKTIREKVPLRPSSQMAQQRQTASSSGAKDATLRSLHTTIDKDLDWIVMKCLEKVRVRRYETANGLAMDLKRHLDNEPVVARPPSVAYRFQKAWRRNRMAFGAVAAVLAVLSLGVIVGTWQAVHLNRALERAETHEERARRQAYAATVRLVAQNWADQNVAQIRRLLNEAQKYDSPGFEWYFWQRLANQEQQVFFDRAVPVSALALSPDGARLYVGRSDGTLEIRTVTDGHLDKTIRAHAGSIVSVDVSPDGRWLVTGSRASTARIWNARDGAEVHCLKKHAAPVLDVAFSPDGSRLASAGLDRTVRIWKVPSFRQEQVLTVQDKLDDSLAVAFSPTGNRLVTSGSNGAATVWDLDAGKEVLQLVPKDADFPIGAIDYSPDGTRIATAPAVRRGGAGGRIRIWNASTEVNASTGVLEADTVSSIQFLSNNELATAGVSSLTIRDIATETVVHRFTGHAGLISDLEVKPDGSGFITGGSDGSIRIWPKIAERFPRRNQTSHPVYSVAIAPDGRFIYSGHLDGVIRVRHREDLQEFHHLMGHTDVVTSLAVSPDGRLLLSGSEDGSVRLWDVFTYKELPCFDQDHPERVRQVAFSADGDLALAAFDGTVGGKVRIWSTPSGETLQTIFNPSGVEAACFDRDGTHVTLGLFDSTLMVKDWREDRIIWQSQEHRGTVSTVACSPDGTRVVSGDSEVVRVWDFNSGTKLTELRGHTDIIEHAVFSSDGRRLFTGSFDGTIQIWDTRTGQELLVLEDRAADELRLGYDQRILALALSRDGRLAVSGNGSGTLRAWEAASADQAEEWMEMEDQWAEQWEVADVEQRLQDSALAEALTGGEGVISQWLVLAPIPYDPRESGVGSAAVNSEQIADERHLMPSEGDECEVKGQRLKWSQVTTGGHILDFKSVLGEAHIYSVAYAVAYIQSEFAQTDLLLKVGRDDQAKVYLNGQQLSLWPDTKSLIPDGDVIEEVALQKGINTLVFKVVNEQASWQGCIRITNRQGKPVPGISVTLDPH